MRKLRVLVVDDSVVVRRMLARTLSADPALEVVATAPNGRIALSRIEQCAPDVVTLDVEMPEMNGLEMLAALRKTHPSLPVIMFSVFTESGSTAALSALAYAAVDYVTKPPTGTGADAASKIIREGLVPKIKLHLLTAVGAECTAPRPKSIPVSHPADFSIQQQAEWLTRRVDVVVIAVSTGGPNALEELLPYFLADFPVPILIVQHMPPVFTKLLANRLAAKSRISITEASANSVLKPGHAWVAPGGSHMAVERINGEARIMISHGPPQNSCRPSADILFRSAADVFGSHVLAVVMTGMGQDGLRGCERIREAGGQILAQDEASSVVWGMPKFVAQAGLVDQILPLGQLGQEITRRVMGFRQAMAAFPIAKV
jgi:two-component system chemotaxis response regulator CheB